MNIMSEAYKMAIDEDAVMSAGDAAPLGDVSAPTEPVDNSIVKAGTSRNDVLGKYDSKKGVFGNGDFNIPVNVFGKGKMLHRNDEIPSLKKKGQKNPYVKGMLLISEKDARDFIKSVFSNKTLQESDSSTAQAISQIRNALTDPSDLDSFVEKHKAEFDRYEQKNSSNGIFSTAWNAVKYAISNGVQFVQKHWWKILIAVLVIALFIWAGNSEKGIELGTKVFGKGYGKFANGAKKAAKAIKHIGPAFLAKFASNDVEIIPDELVDQEVIVYDDKNRVWISNLIDDPGRICIASGSVEDGVTSEWRSLRK